MGFFNLGIEGPGLEVWIFPWIGIVTGFHGEGVNLGPKGGFPRFWAIKAELGCKKGGCNRVLKGAERV